MARLIVAALAALLMMPVAAFAKTFPIPSDDPIATISIPEKWEPQPYEGGVEATSADGAVYVAVEMVRASDVESATTEGIEWFAKQGVKIDVNSLKTQEVKLNGLDAFDIEMAGEDSKGPTQAGLTLVATNAQGKFLMVYFWGSEKGQQDNIADLKSIAQSLQATK